MKDNSTSFNSTANAQRYRNQATGVSPSLTTSEQQGARRSVRVIDAAPVTQLRVADRSYPAPGPSCDPLTGALVDRVTGKKWKPEPQVSTPGLFTR